MPSSTSAEPAREGSAQGAGAEPRPAPDVAPFDLPGKGAAAALCLHGLTGTPYEVRPLAEALSRAGIRAMGPALPGHNQTPALLARTSHDEWLEAARGHLQTLRDEHARVFVVGVSLGGLLSLALAAERPVEGVVVVGTPLRFSLGLRTIIPLIAPVVGYVKKRGGSDIREPGARSRHPSYDVMPLASVAELIRLQRRVRSLLPRVNAPILIAHGVHDRTASPADARSIHANVASAQRQLLMLEASAHVATVDYDGALLARSAAEFLNRFA